jgi:hypothetical protein
MDLSKQSDLPAFFSLWKVNLKKKFLSIPAYDWQDSFDNDMKTKSVSGKPSLKPFVE